MSARVHPRLRIDGDCESSYMNSPSTPPSLKGYPHISKVKSFSYDNLSKHYSHLKDSGTSTTPTTPTSSSYISLYSSSSSPSTTNSKSINNSSYYSDGLRRHSLTNAGHTPKNQNLYQINYNSFANSSNSINIYSSQQNYNFNSSFDSKSYTAQQIPTNFSGHVENVNAGPNPVKLANTKKKSSQLLSLDEELTVNSSNSFAYNDPGLTALTNNLMNINMMNSRGPGSPYIKKLASFKHKEGSSSSLTASSNSYKNNLLLKKKVTFRNPLEEFMVGDEVFDYEPTMKNPSKKFRNEIEDYKNPKSTRYTRENRCCVIS